VSKATSSERRNSEEPLLVEELTHRMNNEFAAAIAVVSLAASRREENPATCRFVPQLVASSRLAVVWHGGAVYPQRRQSFGAPSLRCYPERLPIAFTASASDG
jgi:hypothetical protein